MNDFTFAGKSASSFGLRVTATGSVFAPAVRSTSVYNIPYRDGDLIVDNGKYNNINVTYEVSLATPKGDLPLKMRSIRNWLTSTIGYAELTDTYNDGEYRLGMFSGNIDIAIMAMLGGGTAKLTFNCKPLRYSTAGNINIEDDREPIFIDTRKFYSVRPVYSIEVNPNIVDSINIEDVYASGYEGTIIITIRTAPSGVHLIYVYADKTAKFDNGLDASSYVECFGDISLSKKTVYRIYSDESHVSEAVNIGGAWL